MSGKLNNFDPHYFYFRSNYTTSASIYFKKGTKESYISNYYCLDIYDLTQHKLLTRRTVKNSSYEKLTFNFIAGNAYYMRIDKTGSDYDPYFDFYFEGFDTIVGTGLNSDQTSHIFRSVSVFYEQSYILPVPTNGNIKFAGWYDKNGIQFTDDNGHSFKKWSLLSDITLYAHWQI